MIYDDISYLIYCWYLRRLMFHPKLHWESWRSLPFQIGSALPGAPPPWSTTSQRNFHGTSGRGSAWLKKTTWNSNTLQTQITKLFTFVKTDIQFNIFFFFGGTATPIDRQMSCWISCGHFNTWKSIQATISFLTAQSRKQTSYTCEWFCVNKNIWLCIYIYIHKCIICKKIYIFIYIHVI